MSVTKSSSSSSGQRSTSTGSIGETSEAEFNEYVKKGKAATSGAKIAKIAAKKGGVAKLLKAYAFYKQATEGPAPCDADLSKLKGRDRKMRDAWIELGDMSKAAAKRAYIDHIKMMLGETGTKTSNDIKQKKVSADPDNPEATLAQTEELNFQEPWSGVTLADGTIQAEPRETDVNLQERFEAVAEVVAEHGISYHAMRNGRFHFMHTFALFKQATEGDVPDDMTAEDLNMIDQHILPYWAKMRGMPEETAKVEYIKFVQRTHFDKQAGGAQHASANFIDEEFSSHVSMIQYPMNYVVLDDGADDFLSKALAQTLTENGEATSIITDIGTPSKGNNKMRRKMTQKFQVGCAVYYFVTERTDLDALAMLAKACAKAKCTFHLAVGQQGLGVLETTDHFEKLTETNVDLEERETHYSLGLGAKSCLAEQMLLALRKSCDLRYRVYRLGLILCNREGQLYPATSALRLLHFADHHRQQLGANGLLPLLADGKMYPMMVEDAVEQMSLLSHTSNLDTQIFHISGSCEMKISQFLNLVADANGLGPKFMPSDEDSAALELRMGVNQAAHFEPIHQMIKLGDPRGLLNGIFGIPRDAGVMYAGPVSEVQVRSAHTKGILHAIGATQEVNAVDLASLAPTLWASFRASASVPNGNVLATLPQYVSDRVCIVTGASCGIGRALALALARAKAKVVICARSVEKLETLKAEILQINGSRRDRVLLMRCDVTVEEDCDSLIKQTMEQFGTIHVLFNNAGRSIFRPFADQEKRVHDFSRVVAVNYLGPASLMLKIVPIMRAQRFGAIINVNSEVVNTGAKWFGCYAASKSALGTLSSSVSAEASVDNVMVSDIYLPLVETDMVSDTVEGFSRPWTGVEILTVDKAVEDCLSVFATGFRDVHSSRIGQVGKVMSSHMPRFLEYYWNTRIPF
eukprot:Clim_evm2s37 gene=Clim_evmTU2s37